MKNATKELMGDLHGELVKDLLAKIRSGEATSADRNVARQMLKDNNIECVAAPNTPLKDLADLPVFNDTEQHMPRGPLQ